MVQLVTDTQIILTFSSSENFSLDSVKSWLMPLSLAVECEHLSPPKMDSFSHLPCEAVLGSCHDFGSITSNRVWMFILDMFQHKRFFSFLSKVTLMFPSPSVKIPGSFSMVYSLLAIWAKLTFYVVVHSTSTAVTTITPAILTWQAVCCFTS